MPPRLRLASLRARLATSRLAAVLKANLGPHRLRVKQSEVVLLIAVAILALLFIPIPMTHPGRPLEARPEGSIEHARIHAAIWGVEVACLANLLRVWCRALTRSGGTPPSRWLALTTSFFGTLGLVMVPAAWVTGAPLQALGWAAATAACALVWRGVRWLAWDGPLLLFGAIGFGMLRILGGPGDRLSMEGQLGLLLLACLALGGATLIGVEVALWIRHGVWAPTDAELERDRWRNVRDELVAALQQFASFEGQMAYPRWNPWRPIRSGFVAAWDPAFRAVDAEPEGALAAGAFTPGQLAELRAFDARLTRTRALSSTLLEGLEAHLATPAWHELRAAATTLQARLSANGERRGDQAAARQSP